MKDEKGGDDTVQRTFPFPVLEGNNMLKVLQ